MSGRGLILLPGLTVMVARTFRQRLVGLLGHGALAADRAMLITPCNNIHTAFMRFAIDAVFLDEHARVLAVCPRIKPFRIAAARHARACLEMQAGRAESLDIRVGDRMAPLAQALGKPR